MNIIKKILVNTKLFNVDHIGEKETITFKPFTKLLFWYHTKVLGQSGLEFNN